MATITSKGDQGAGIVWQEGTMWIGDVAPVNEVDEGIIAAGDKFYEVPYGAVCAEILDGGKAYFNNGTVTLNSSVNVGPAGGININNGIVVTNRGTIITNQLTGTVTNNYGTITTNNNVVTSHNGGEIVTNASGAVIGGISNGAIVTSNHGTLDSCSYGTVVTNETDGVITQTNWHVTTNNGSIPTLGSGGGQVDVNQGTIDSCDGVVLKNVGTVTLLTINGTVYQFAGGIVSQNSNGVINIAEVGATFLGTNAGTVQVVAASFTNPTAAMVKKGTTFKFNTADVTGTLSGGEVIHGF